jgi:hypothetical protein
MLDPDIQDIDAFEAMNARMREAWADRLELELNGIHPPPESHEQSL